MMYNKFCIANWKMYLNNNESELFINKFNDSNFSNINCEIVICPSFTSILSTLKLNSLNNFKIGSQDISVFDSGAFTGQVSLDMINDLDCLYSIIGHSERRLYCNESDKVVSDKFDLLHSSFITPIICIGETIDERKKGIEYDTIENQLKSFLSNKNIDLTKQIIIAYEPIWAIGTGLSADIETIEKMHSHIKNIINNIIPNNCNIYIVYGGSVNENNASNIIQVDNVNGFLIGSASLDPDIFYNICKTL